MSVLTTAITLNYAAPAFGQDKAATNADPARTADVQIPFQAQQSPLFSFSGETFRPYVGGVFVVRAGGKSIKMTLERVRDCRPKSTTKITKGTPRPTDCFALEFSATEELTDLTSIYDVEHGALGEFPLFMTQRKGPAGTFHYEAVFNHVL